MIMHTIDILGGGHTPLAFSRPAKGIEQGGRCGLRQGMEHPWRVAASLETKTLYPVLARGHV